MSTSGIPVFEHTIQETNLWLARRWLPEARPTVVGAPPRETSGDDRHLPSLGGYGMLDGVERITIE